MDLVTIKFRVGFFWDLAEKSRESTLYVTEAFLQLNVIKILIRFSQDRGYETLVWVLFSLQDAKNTKVTTKMYRKTTQKHDY